MQEKKKLILDSKKLSNSEIVANASMNRNRGFHGVNSYSRELRLDFKSLIKESLHEKKKFSWLDLCCGVGRALIEGGRFLKEEFKKDEINEIKIIGIDLIDDFVPIPPDLNFITFKQGILPEALPDLSFDLITCVHGFHYLGDKLDTIAKISSLLANDGFFIGNISHKNLKSEKGSTLRGILKIFTTFPHSYSSASHILKIKGGYKFKYNYKYIGSSDDAGRNYTNQKVVDSFYIKL